MDVKDLLARRSIRKYTAEAVDEQSLHRALETAMAAPSAMHCDPWRFVVITEPGALNALADCLPYGQMLRHAGAGFIVCGDLHAAHRGELSYLLQDVSAATENLLLALHAQGLGAVWLGIHPTAERVEAVRKAFGLPEEIVPVAAVAVGHPAEHPEARTRYDASKVHRNRWTP